MRTSPLYLLAMIVVMLLAYSVIAFSVRATSWGAVYALRIVLRNMHRAVFDRSEEFRRRALTQSYLESATALDLTVGPLDAGLVAPRGLDGAELAIVKARHTLYGLFRPLSDTSTREPDLTYLAEHIAVYHLRSPSSVVAVKEFLITEVELLSDTPHAIDGHIDRLMEKFFPAKARGRAT